MMNLFDDFNNLETLIAKATDRQLSSEVKKLILSSDNSEELKHQIIRWLNSLFNQYNTRIKSKTTSTELDVVLYDIIYECVPYVSIEYQLILQVNLCILSDDDNNDLLHASFIGNISMANSIVDKLLLIAKQGTTVSIDDNLLASLGCLNFRAHNYSKAQTYLHICTHNLNVCIESGTATDDQKLQYISSKIFLASCLEYQASIDIVKNRKTTLSNAISELLGFECSTLEKTISQQHIAIAQKINLYYSENHYIDLSPKDRYTNVIRFIDELKSDDSKNNNVISQLISIGFDDDYCQTVRNEYFHVLAHCISEYAVVLREEEHTPYPLCSILQMLSRFLLDWLVAQGNDDYATCQATVRAENDATPEAIELLLKQIPSKINMDNESEKTKYAELIFFIFYFSEQELRLAYDNDQMFKIFDHYRKEFFEYAQNEADSENFDPLFHYYIVYFRYLLKQATNNIIISSSNKSMHSENTELNKIYNELIVVSTKISGHVLKPVRDEFHRLKKLFELYNQIKNISSEYTLSNEATAEFDLLLHYHNPYLTNDVDYGCEMKKIYNEIVEPRNILLLAPVPNAPSCSFRIKNIDQLIPLNFAPSYKSPIDFSDFIEEQVHKLDQVRIDKGITIRVNKKVEPYFKWAIHFDSSKLFLFYSNSSLSKDLKMFPVILNENEQNRCLAIFNSFADSLKSIHSKKCKSPVEICKNNKFNVCYSSVFTSANKELYDSLLELLVFLEFDFQDFGLDTKKYTSRIKNDDIIIVYHKRRETEYRIMGFSHFDVDNVRDQICHICEFSLPDKNNLVVNSTTESSSVEGVQACQKVNFKKAHSQLTHMLSKITNPTAQVYQKIDMLIKMVEKCENSSSCPYLNERTSNNCRLLNQLLEINIQNVYGKEFDG